MPGEPLKVPWLKRALANLEAEPEYISRDSHRKGTRKCQGSSSLPCYGMLHNAYPANTVPMIAPP